MVRITAKDIMTSNVITVTPELPVDKLAGVLWQNKISGAPVVPFFQMRLPGNQGYLVMLCPALNDFPGHDPETDSARINRLLETVIREIPEQYLWIHRRFKTRPQGEPCPYS